ncbi:hypothetical protein HED60_03805 [Planctomycetales bacterium ZRK34]|nr:hypothetical protein HED60_03805 [Planctomycetales bacterium ZRK34]
MIMTRLQQTMIVAALTWVVCAAASPAAIVALDPDDAQGGYTTSTTIIPDEGIGWPNAAGDDDDQWGYSGTNTQAQLGSAATNTAAIDNEVWVSRNDLGENVPLLTTTITGLLDTETYDVYLFYVTNTTEDWRMRAAASGDALVEYDDSDGTIIESDGVLQLRRVIVLNDATPTGGALALDIDASAATALGNVRGFFKGIGVDGLAATIPTPAALPAGLVGLGLLVMRRK